MNRAVIIAAVLALSAAPTVAAAQHEASSECIFTGVSRGKAVFLGADRTLGDFEAALKSHETVIFDGTRQIGERLAISFRVVDPFAETEDRWDLELRKDARRCWAISRARLNDEPPVDGVFAYPLLSVLFPTQDAVETSPRRIERAEIGTKSPNPADPK